MRENIFKEKFHIWLQDDGKLGKANGWILYEVGDNEVMNLYGFLASDEQTDRIENAILAGCNFPMFGVKQGNSWMIRMVSWYWGLNLDYLVQR